MVLTYEGIINMLDLTGRKVDWDNEKHQLILFCEHNKTYTFNKNRLDNLKDLSDIDFKIALEVKPFEDIDLYEYQWLSKDDIKEF